MLIDKYLYEYDKQIKENPLGLPKNWAEDPRAWIAYKLLDDNGITPPGQDGYNSAEFKRFYYSIDEEEGALIYCIAYIVEFRKALYTGNRAWFDRNCKPYTSAKDIERRLRYMTATGEEE